MIENIQPNLIISGVNKAGTTSIFSYLSNHPDVCASSIKETCYFLPLRYGKELSPFSEYLEYFCHCSRKKYVMEATPGYFYGGESVAKAIKERLGNVKILIIFREPVARLFSFYKSKKSTMELDRRISFESYIRICENLAPCERRKQENNVYWGIEGGFYSNYLDTWLNVFGHSVKVLFFENLHNNRALFMKELCEWLQIDYAKLNLSNLEVENRTLDYGNGPLHKIALQANVIGERFFRSNPAIKKFARKIYYALNGKVYQDAMPENVKDYLEAMFRPYNKRLAHELTQLGYDNLPHWLTHK